MKESGSLVCWLVTPLDSSPSSKTQCLLTTPERVLERALKEGEFNMVGVAKYSFRLSSIASIVSETRSSVVCGGGTCWRSFRLKRDRQRGRRVNTRDIEDLEAGRGPISTSVDGAAVCSSEIEGILESLWKVLI